MAFEDKVLTGLAELTQRMAMMDNRISGLEDKILGLEDRIQSMDKRLATVENDLEDAKKTALRMENDHGKKLDVLFEGSKQNTQAILELSKEVKMLGQKIDEQEIKLKVVK